MALDEKSEESQSYYNSSRVEHEFMQHISCQAIQQLSTHPIKNHKCQAACVARGKVRGSPRR